MIECAIFGGLILDKYLEVEAYPERGGDGLITDEFDIAGGCSINMAVTFNNLGGNAHIVSYVGCDQTGREIMEYLDRYGFSTKYVKQTEGGTGYSLVFLEKNGERTFLTKKGVESRFDRELLRTGVAGGSDFKNIMMTGYYLLCDNPAELVKCLSEIKEKDGCFLFDPGPLIQKIDPDVLRKVIAMADIIAMNEAEAEIAGLPEDASKIVVIKKGKFGGEVYNRGERFEYKAAAVTEVDTTGAGDSFDAGLMFGILSGMDVRSAVSLAVESAAKTVAVKGPHGFWKMEVIL